MALKRLCEFSVKVPKLLFTRDLASQRLSASTLRRVKARHLNQGFETSSQISFCSSSNCTFGILLSLSDLRSST